MEILANVLVGFVALLHLYFLVLEMFLWTKPLGLKVFRNTPEKAETTKVLAANQGLYNGFLAAGLFWSAVAPEPLASPLRLFFAGCVLVAGLYGGATASRSIFFFQAVPGALALLASLMARGGGAM
jgi:putative membrane protein